jgi:hypothetical protein
MVPRPFQAVDVQVVPAVFVSDFTTNSQNLPNESQIFWRMADLIDLLTTLMILTSEADTSCMSQMGAPEFVLGLGGTGDIELVTYASDMFESVVPAGWNELQPGMFARSDPAVHKTLFAQLAAPAEHAEEMIGALLGEFSLTSLPDRLRTMPTDALTWQVYLPAGIVPLIIAKAEIDQATYLLVLVASKGELDSLAESVLISAIVALTPIQ